MNQGFHVFRLGGFALHHVERHVLGGGLESVQSIAQLLPSSPRQQYLVLPQTAALPQYSRLIVPLAVASSTELLRSTRSFSDGKRLPAPFAQTRGFRHSDETLHGAGANQVEPEMKDGRHLDVVSDLEGLATRVCLTAKDLAGSDLRFR